MRKVISIHSSRGGTGKSVIAVNLAIILSKKGYSVSLLDLDFRAPSLFYTFKNGVREPIRFWLNDFFNGKCELDQALINIPESRGTDKEILIGLANPSLNAIRDMMGKSRSWEASALKKLYSIRSIILNEMNIDYLIYDTSPGIQYSSINAIISSNLPIVVTTSDPLDIESVRNMTIELYDIFQKKTVILVNKVYPETELMLEEEEKEFVNKLEETLTHPIMGIIPCYCDVLKAKRNHFLFNPDCPFNRRLEKIAEKLNKFLLNSN